MAIGDVYMLRDVQTMQGQQVENVYFYEQRDAFVPVGPPNNASALAAGWTADILPLIRATQSPAVLHVEVECQNLFDVTDYGLYAVGQAGTNAGSGNTPSFVAWGFTFKPDSKVVRPGGKRIAGVLENQNDEGIPVPAMLPALQAAADAMASPIPAGLIITEDVMFPVIVKRINDGVPGAPQYRLPESQAELTLAGVAEVLLKAIVTSQVSRKIGTGV